MTKVFVEKIDEVYMRIHGDPSTVVEMGDYFSFFAKDYKFHPKFKAGWWDGKIRLLNVMSGMIYIGLISYVQKFCADRDYVCEIDPKITQKDSVYPEDFGYELAKQFDAPFTPHDFQNEAVVNSLNEIGSRSMMLSPTASGKSFILYLLARHHAENLGHKILIIAPTVDLVNQLNNDFTDYNNDVPLNTHKIYAGKEKQADVPYTFSTWQSLHRIKDKEYFEQYDVVIVDEAHNAKAKSLTGILEKCETVKHKYGMTGTIDDATVNKLTFVGLFGNILNVRTTKQLIDDGILSELRIKCLVLNHTKASRALNTKNREYEDEFDWLISHEARNKFICKLADKIEGNTLILFQRVEAHGDLLKNIFDDMGAPVSYIHGKIPTDEREIMIQNMKKSKNGIILASYGTFSTGINIPNLDNLILASPTKSKIRNLQSIGRILRKPEGKSHATLYDIADDLTKGKKANYTLKHFMTRVEIYNKQKFNYNLINIDMKE